MYSVNKLDWSLEPKQGAVHWTQAKPFNKTIHSIVGLVDRHQWDQEDDGEDKLELVPLMPFRADDSNPNTDSQHATTATPVMAPTLPITLHHYLALVDWTGR